MAYITPIDKLATFVPREVLERVSDQGGAE